MLTCVILGWVARKPVNANPGLKVNRTSNCSGIKMFCNSFGLCRMRLLALKSEGQIKNINRKPHRKVTDLKLKFSLIPGYQF